MCCPACCTAACCGRPRSARRSKRSTNPRSPRLPGVRVVRIADFVGVVAADEWAAVRAARELKVRWSESATLIGHDALVDWARSGPFVAEEVIAAKGDAQRIAALGGAADVAARDLLLADPVARLDRPVVRRRRRARRRRHGLDRVAGQPSLPRHLRGAGRPAARQAARHLPRRRRLLRHERPRRCRRRCGAAVEGGRQAGARAMEPPGRARLGSEGPAAAARAEGDADRRRPHRCLGNRHVGAARDRQPRVGAAAGAARRGHAPAGRAVDRAGVAERRSALSRQRGQGLGALARPGAAAAVEHPRARQGRRTASRSRASSTSSPPGRRSIRSRFACATCRIRAAPRCCAGWRR